MPYILYLGNNDIIVDPHVLVSDNVNKDKMSLEDVSFLRTQGTSAFLSSDFIVVSSLHLISQQEISVITCMRESWLDSGTE